MNGIWKLCCAVAVACVIAGCGMDDRATGSSGESSSAIDDYTGTWEWQEGSATDVNCPNDSSSVPMSGTEELIEGTDGDLVFTGDECTWRYDVNGDTASLASGQSCEVEGQTQQGVRYEDTYNWSTYTFTVSGDTMTVSANGTLRRDFQTGDRVECSLSTHGSMKKIGG